MLNFQYGKKTPMKWLSSVGQLSNKVVYTYKYTPVTGPIMTKILFKYFRVCDFMKNNLKRMIMLP